MKILSMMKCSVLLGLAFFMLTFLPATSARAQACVCCQSCGVCCGDGAVKAAAEASSKGSQTASYLAQWAQEAAAWLKQFSFLTTIIGLFNQFNQFIGNQYATLSAVAGGVSQAATEALVRTAEGRATSDSQSRSAQAVAQVAGSLTPPPNTNQALCNVIATHQGRDGANWWQRMLGGQIAQIIQDRNRGRGITTDNQYAYNEDGEPVTADGARVIKVGMIGNRYRGPGTDGAGPQYAADERDLRCGKINGVKTANPIDGYDSSCTPATSDAFLIDADLRYSTMDGTQVFEVPTLVENVIPIVNVHVFVPTVSNKAQQLYIAATNYCAFAAGPRPTPPNGKDLTSPEGIVQTAAFDHEAAQESAFVTQCANRVAYLTKPNCDDSRQYGDPGIKATCDAANRACAAYKANNNDKLPLIIDPSGANNCPNGLSPYQMDYLAHTDCTLSQFYIQGAGAGANHGKLMNFSSWCDLGFTEWQAKIAKENLSLVKAFNGLAHTTYTGAERTPNKTMRIKAPGKLKPHDNEEADLDNAPTVKKTAVGKKATPVMNPPHGINLINLPIPASH